MATAELIGTDGTRFSLSGGDVLVGRRSEDGAFAPDIDLGGLPGGRSVSRRHARLVRVGTAWYLRVETTARNATLVGGRALEPGARADVHDGDEITLGRVRVTFRAQPVPQPELDGTHISPRHATERLEVDGVVFPLLAAHGRELSLGRHTDDLRLRPDIDLHDLDGGATVSRRHAELFRRDGTWWLRVAAEATNVTWINGRQVERGRESVLSDGVELRFGRVSAVFREEAAARYVDEGVLDLVLGPPTTVSVQPGAQTRVPLTLRNFSGHVNWFELDVAGVPPSWCHIERPTGNAEPDALGQPIVRLLTSQPPLASPESTAEASVLFSPPRSAAARAGAYPLVFSATSKGEERLRRSVVGEMTLLPYADLRMQAATSMLTGARGVFDVNVENHGNTPVDLDVRTEANEKLVDCKVDQALLRLANGEGGRLNVHARAKHRAWLGAPVVHPVRVSVADGELASGTADVQLVCPPRIPVWVQALFGRMTGFLKPVVVPIAVLAIALGLAFVILRPPRVKLTVASDVVGNGQPVALSWEVDRGSGSGTLELPEGSQNVDLPSGAFTTTPTQTTDYKLTAGNWFGLTGTDTQRVRVVRVLSFTASSDSLKQEGDPLTLQWATENATRVTIDPGDEITNPGTSGKVLVHPRVSTTYHLVATHVASGASDTAEVPVNFGNSKIPKFEPDKQQAYPGDRVLLTWTAEGFSNLSLKSNTDDLELSGEIDVTRRTSFQVRPLHSAEYTLTARNADGAPIEARVDVTVLPVKAPKLQAPTQPVSAGERATLAWQIEGANDRTVAVLQPGIGDVSGRSSIDINPVHSEQYTLRVTSADGQTVSSEPVAVVVIPSVQAFTVTPAALADGEPVQISWSVLDADSVSVTRDDGTVVAIDGAADQTRDYPPLTTTSYRLMAHNASGDMRSGPNTVARITVQPAPDLPPLFPDDGFRTPGGDPPPTVRAN